MRNKPVLPKVWTLGALLPDNFPKSRRYAHGLDEEYLAKHWHLLSVATLRK